MNKDDDLPSEVYEFITHRILSVPELEALLLFWRHPNEAWTEERLMQALYITPAIAKSIVAQLLRRNWIKHGTHAREFVYDSAWDPDGLFMSKLASTYRTHLVRIATLIHSNLSAAVRGFANAFDFKKE